MGYTRDQWFITVKDADGNETRQRTARHGSGKRWLAMWRDPSGKARSKTFDKKALADKHWRSQETDVTRGTYVDPKSASTTVEAWCDTWLGGYGTRRPGTVRQARVHIAQIKRAFGEVPLSGVRPSAVKAWTAGLRAEGLSESYVYALHGRLSQLLTDAVHDGVLARNPCSRRTSPGGGKQRPYCATTEQVWAIYDAYDPHLRPAVLLGAFVGLRTSEAAGLRVADVEFMRGVVTPAVQHPAKPLKTDTSKTPVPIPRELALELSAAVARWGSDWVVTDGMGGQASPWSIERAMRSVRKAHVRPLPDGHRKDCAGCLVPGLPAGFRFHDLRHYLASLLIADGADVKVVQARLRHASAKTTLDVYSHLWPDADESTRVTVGAVFRDRGGLAKQTRSTSAD